MKEAFWGVLIVLLGLFGIVVVNIFQNVTVDNDRVYYLIKESTEASAYDALDLTYYRLSGKLRIAEDKFVENLTRRFAENVTIGDYKIVVEDINEMPPKISLRVRSGVTSLRGEEFGVVNRVDGILETKYKFDEVRGFLGIDDDEWNKETEGSTIEKDENTGENICKVITNNKDEIECIPGDMKFIGFEDADVVEAVCQGETPSGNKERKVKYKVCDCGKWVEESEILTTSPVKVGNEWVYTWTFNKVGEIRTISETIKSRVRIDVCTTAIGEMVPKDIHETKPKEDGSAHEPSKDNSNYISCPAGGIKIPIGMKFIMHPNYIPPESVNRNLEWSTTDSSIVGVLGSNPTSTCWLNKEGTNCFSRATITAKGLGTAYVNVKTTRNQTATCKVEVFDGKVDSVGCKDMEIYIGGSDMIDIFYEPKNATITNFEYSISNTDVATISGNTITAKAGGTATITIKETNTGKTGTCTLKVPYAQEISIDGGNGNTSSNYKYIVIDHNGNRKYFNDRKQAVEYAENLTGESQVVSKNTDGRHYVVNEVNTKCNGTGHCSVINNDKLTGETIRSDKTYTPSDVAGGKPNKGSSGSGSNGNTNKLPNGKKDAPDPPAPTRKPAAPSLPKPAPKPTPKPAPKPAPKPSVCLAEGTKIKIANGSTKNIEDITYDDLLLVWDYENGTYTYEYPIWIEKENYSSSYTHIEFSDGSYLNVVGNHALYDLDKNEFVNMENIEVGSKIAKIIDNNINEVEIVSIEEVNKTTKYYHVVSTRYYNVIANDILTTDDMVILSNLYGFNNNISWENRDYQNIDLYKYEEFSDILPYYLFKGLRVEEANVLSQYISKNEFRMYLLENQLNPNMILLPKTNLFGKRVWMVTTSDDNLNLLNKNKYLMTEGSKYVVPNPSNKLNFVSWYSTVDGKYYNPGDIIKINMGTHLVAIYR